MRRIGLLLAVTLFSVDNAAFPDEIVKRLDLKKALEVASVYELIEEGVRGLCNEFPELKPEKKEELILLKRQIIYFIKATAAERDEALLGSPTKFGLISKKFMQLRKIAKREFPKLNATEKARLTNEEGYMLDKIVWPVQDHVDTSAMIHAAQREKRGYTKEEHREEIENYKIELMDLWHEDDPLHSRYAMLQARKRHRTRAAMMFVKRKEDKRSAAYELVKKGNYSAILEYASVHELAETIVDTICKLYPVLELRNATGNKLLKLQVAWFITTERSLRKKVLKRFEEQFSPLTTRQDELFTIAYNEFEKLTEWQQKTALRDSEHALKRRLIQIIVLDHLEAKMASYEQRGLTEEQRKKEIRSKDIELKEDWSSEAMLASMLPDVLTEKWREEEEQKIENGVQGEDEDGDEESVKEEL